MKKSHESNVLRSNAGFSAQMMENLAKAQIIIVLGENIIVFCTQQTTGHSLNLWSVAI